MTDLSKLPVYPDRECCDYIRYYEGECNQAEQTGWTFPDEEREDPDEEYSVVQACTYRLNITTYMLVRKKSRNHYGDRR